MDEEKAREIVEAVEGHVTEISPLSGGATHHMFLIELEDEEFVFQGVGSRWHDFPAFETGYRVEPVMLKFLDQNGFAAPEPRFHDFSKEEFDQRFLGIEKVEGRDMNKVEDKELFFELVKQTGRKLRELHNLKAFKQSGKLVSDNSGIKVRGFEWSEMYKSLLFTYTTHMMERKYDHLREDIEKIVEENQKHLEARRFAFVHQEFGPRNIMVNEGSIEGVVDWERSISGDPMFDYVQTRERMIQKAKDLRVDTPREKVKSKLEKSYGESEVSDVSPEKDDLYRLAYLAQMMWVARQSNPEKYDLEEQFRSIQQRLTS